MILRNLFILMLSLILSYNCIAQIPRSDSPNISDVHILTFPPIINGGLFDFMQANIINTQNANFVGCLQLQIFEQNTNQLLLDVSSSSFEVQSSNLFINSANASVLLSSNPSHLIVIWL